MEAGQTRRTRYAWPQLTQFRTDRGQVILQKCLVDAFTNSPDDALRIPPEVKAAFESRKGTVKEFLASHTGSSALQRLDALQDTLLCPINISSGKYSIYHETAARALVSAASWAISECSPK